MKLLFLLFIGWSSFSYSQEKNNLYLNYTLKEPNSKDILDKFYKYINVPLNNSENTTFWTESNFLKYPETDILDIITNAENHKITILSINNSDDKRSLIKIAWIKTSNNYGNLYAIYNIYAVKKNNEILFENVLDYNVKDFKTFDLDEIKYVTYKEHIFNYTDAKKMLDFNKKISLFFEKETINFTYFLCKDMNHFKRIRGFDFDKMMVEQNQNGGETFPADNVIFAGNNSEFYPHEVVHLYTFKYFSNIHKIIDEGIATYFGGSKGIEFKEHIKKLKNHLNENDLNVYEKLFKESEQYILDDISSLWYTVGALLCDVSLKKQGEIALLELMNSGKTDEELLLSIEKIFKIKRENFDSFIKKELQNY
ncbi:hypothetical protein L1S34_12165 [Flavobacterium sp. K77]|uniref:hypothetical protein n=1 Tax=Flavobacterium sp. K77 TaxID=2910676 RepID=UPI001F334F82|nr:hypothetical protein [Flavobacterium sp. K77]MCF6142043.1 hypothetical protein [Flavobacterium sp. K77]